MVKNTIGDWLKDKRLNRGLSQADVADFFGYTSAQFISNWECNRSEPPNEIIPELLKLYKVKESEFVKVMLEDTKQKLKEIVRDSRIKVGYKRES